MSADEFQLSFEFGPLESKNGKPLVISKPFLRTGALPHGRRGTWRELALVVYWFQGTTQLIGDVPRNFDGLVLLGVNPTCLIDLSTWLHSVKRHNHPYIATSLIFNPVTPSG